MTARKFVIAAVAALTLGSAAYAAPGSATHAVPATPAMDEVNWSHSYNWCKRFKCY